MELLEPLKILLIFTYIPLVSTCCHTHGMNHCDSKGAEKAIYENINKGIFFHEPHSHEDRNKCNTK